MRKKMLNLEEEVSKLMKQVKESLLRKVEQIKLRGLGDRRELCENYIWQLFDKLCENRNDEQLVFNLLESFILSLLEVNLDNLTLEDVNVIMEEQLPDFLGSVKEINKNFFIDDNVKRLVDSKLTRLAVVLDVFFIIFRAEDEESKKDFMKESLIGMIILYLIRLREYLASNYTGCFFCQSDDAEPLVVNYVLSPDSCTANTIVYNSEENTAILSETVWQGILDALNEIKERLEKIEEKLADKDDEEN